MSADWTGFDPDRAARVAAMVRAHEATPRNEPAERSRSPRLADGPECLEVYTSQERTGTLIRLHWVNLCTQATGYDDVEFCCACIVCVHAGFCGFSPIAVAGVAVTIQTSPDGTTWTTRGTGTTDINGDACVTLAGFTSSSLPLYGRVVFGAWDCGAEDHVDFTFDLCQGEEVDYIYPACSITAYSECGGVSFPNAISLEYYDADLAAWVTGTGESPSITNPCACPGRQYRAHINRCGIDVYSGTVTPSGCPASYAIHLEVPPVPTQNWVVDVTGGCGSVLPGATVTVLDGDGASVVGTTNGSGRATLAVGGLKPCVTLKVEADRHVTSGPSGYTLGCSTPGSPTAIGLSKASGYQCVGYCAYPIEEVMSFTYSAFWGSGTVTITWNGSYWDSGCINIGAFGIGSIRIQFPNLIQEWTGAGCTGTNTNHSLDHATVSCPPGAFSESGSASGFASYSVAE